VVARAAAIYRSDMLTISNTSEQDSPCARLRRAGLCARERGRSDHPHFGKLFPCHLQAGRIEQQRAERLRAREHLTKPVAHDLRTPLCRKGHGLSPDKASNLRGAFAGRRPLCRGAEGLADLLGGYGCGKTHLAAAIANRCVERGRRPFVTVPDLLDYLRAAFKPGQRYPLRPVVLTRFAKRRCLSSTTWGRRAAHPGPGKAFQILNYRHNARLPTVITSNQTLEEIDLRLRSRMVDPDLSVVRTILAPDFRRSGVESEPIGLCRPCR